MKGLFFSTLLIQLIIISCTSNPVYISELIELQNDTSLIRATLLDYTREEVGIGGMNKKIYGNVLSFKIKLENISNNKINIIWENSIIFDNNGVQKLFVFRPNSNDPSFYFQKLFLPSETFSIFELTSLDIVSIGVTGTGTGIGTQIGSVSIGSSVSTSTNTFKFKSSFTSTTFKVTICYNLEENEELKYYDFVINIIEK